MAASLMIEVLDDPDLVARRAADWVIEHASVPGERVALALCGGSTPRALYCLLANDPWRAQLPWQKIHVFWGDERFVPHDHPDSNFRLAQQSLLDYVPIPPDNVHPIPTRGTPQAAAASYQEVLRRYYGAARLDPERPLFDIVLLGLGADGHTASLFPGMPTPEPGVWAIAVDREPPRISLSPTALGSSRASAFLVVGADKRGALAGLARGDTRLPAARIPAAGEWRCFADAAAATDIHSQAEGRS